MTLGKTIAKPFLDYDNGILILFLFVMYHSCQLPVIRLLSYIRWVTHKLLGDRIMVSGNWYLPRYDPALRLAAPTQITSHRAHIV